MISIERAREIASHWQSPGRHGIGMAQFASTGAITEALLDDIDRVTEGLQVGAPSMGVYVSGDASTGWVPGDLGTVGRNLAEVRALRTFVDALEVQVWTVGRSEVGGLPVDPPSWHLDYADAVDAFTALLDDAPAYVEGGTTECTCDDDEMCALCSHEAHVKSYVRDEVPSVIAGRVFGDERPLFLALHGESNATSVAHWVSPVVVSVAKYRTLRGAV